MNKNLNINIGASPFEFPRIAKEMGFRFSLKRGRVDWHKIEVIDIDHLIQERDLTSLKDNLPNIMNYNLESEFDVKILDRSFVKLFKLAQLSIDYLMYSEQHLFNCVELIREEYASCIKDNEKLKKDLKKKDDITKNLKKKIKEKGKMKLSNNQMNMYHHSILHQPEVYKVIS
ncbi:Uncharacterized protein GBIM_02420 [Gryllus bimaculatus]|nr:Uncharacterized protein GBIM_02420 [Gryllus bimaculatus]